MVATPAFAQGLYVDAGYQHFSAELNDAGDDTSDVGVLAAHVGFDLGNFLGVEAEGGIGINDATDTIEGVDVEGGVNYSLGVFGRAYLPVGRRIRLYARGGYVSTELEATASFAGESATESETFSGLAYGAGAELFSSNGGGFVLRGDYTRYEFDDGAADAIMLTLGYKLFLAWLIVDEPAPADKATSS